MIHKANGIVSLGGLAVPSSYHLLTFAEAKTLFK